MASYSGIDEYLKQKFDDDPLSGRVVFLTLSNSDIFVFLEHISLLSSTLTDQVQNYHDT